MCICGVRTHACAFVQHIGISLLLCIVSYNLSPSVHRLNIWADTCSHTRWVHIVIHIQGLTADESFVMFISTSSLSFSSVLRLAISLFHGWASDVHLMMFSHPSKHTHHRMGAHGLSAACPAPVEQMTEATLPQQECCAIVEPDLDHWQENNGAIQHCQNNGLQIKHALQQPFSGLKQVG